MFDIKKMILTLVHDHANQETCHQLMARFFCISEDESEQMIVALNLKIAILEDLANRGYNQYSAAKFLRYKDGSGVRNYLSRNFRQDITDRLAESGRKTGRKKS